MREREMGSVTGLHGHQPHAVCMPCPAQGHINAMLRLARLLHAKGLYITFVHTESNYRRILDSNASSSLHGLHDFRFETIPDGPLRTYDHAQDFWSASFGALVRRLNDASSSGSPQVTCIVSDTFTSFTLEAAAEHGIPDVFFCSVSACSYMCFLQSKELRERGFTPLKSESDPTNGYLDTTIDWIPGMKNIRLKNLPTFVRTTDPNDRMFKLVNDEVQKSHEATAIIINTFDDLEASVLEALASILPPIYTIGPVSLFINRNSSPEGQSFGSSFWKEDEDCLQWLDGQMPGSVVYVNFGSITVMSNKQLAEFAWGLANSGHNFLWAIRPDIVKDESMALPEEFTSETKGRGLLVSWCPQEQVLAHSSVGGFLTHGGWNSITESISYGVPMLSWPFFGDQQTNCFYMSDEWGIGMEIDNDVQREQVEGLIKELMEGEKGKEMRKRALEWKAGAVKATEPGGSSFVNLDKVVREVLCEELL